MMPSRPMWRLTRIFVAYCCLQETFSIFWVKWYKHLDSGAVRIPYRVVLRVLGSHTGCCTIRTAKHHWHFKLIHTSSKSYHISCLGPWFIPCQRHIGSHIDASLLGQHSSLMFPHTTCQFPLNLPLNVHTLNLVLQYQSNSFLVYSA